MSKSTVGRMCKDLDEQVEGSCCRPLDHTGFSYVFCDAAYPAREVMPTLPAA